MNVAAFRHPCPRLRRLIFSVLASALFLLSRAHPAAAWNDDTHLAIAKAAGYSKWFNAAAADLIKLKAGDREGDNHYVNNPLDTVVTAEAVLRQAKRYDRPDEKGHLYGAVIAAFRNYREADSEGKYAGHHMSLCAHYVGDLSQPLHNIVYDAYNRKFHQKSDGIINDKVLTNLSKIQITPIVIGSEKDLACEIARIANLSIALANRLESENRLMTQKEAYSQISLSASLFRAIMEYGELSP